MECPADQVVAQGKMLVQAVLQHLDKDLLVDQPLLAAAEVEVAQVPLAQTVLQVLVAMAAQVYLIQFQEVQLITQGAVAVGQVQLKVLVALAAVAQESMVV
jgi:hypothetical protein